MKESGSQESGSQESTSPTQLMDERIEELGDWRGETLDRRSCATRRADI
jgi:hypothetical protein